jgi:hypothetical protein
MQPIFGKRKGGIGVAAWHVARQAKEAIVCQPKPCCCAFPRRHLYNDGAVAQWLRGKHSPLRDARRR